MNSYSTMASLLNCRTVVTKSVPPMLLLIERQWKVLTCDRIAIIIEKISRNSKKKLQKSIKKKSSSNRQEKKPVYFFNKNILVSPKKHYYFWIFKMKDKYKVKVLALQREYLDQIINVKFTLLVYFSDLRNACFCSFSIILKNHSNILDKIPKLENINLRLLISDLSIPPINGREIK
jgi:hypothetical protein